MHLQANAMENGLYSSIPASTAAARAAFERRLGLGFKFGFAERPSAGLRLQILRSSSLCSSSSSQLRNSLRMKSDLRSASGLRPFHSPTHSFTARRLLQTLRV